MIIKLLSSRLFGKLTWLEFSCAVVRVVGKRRRELIPSRFIYSYLGRYVMLTALLILSPAINCVNSNYKQLEDVDDPENQIIEVIELRWSKAADLQCLSSWTLFPRCQSSRTLHYYVSFRIMWTRPTGIGKRAKIVSEKRMNPNWSEASFSVE